MIVFTIALKNIREFFRDIKSNAIIFILPIVFMGLFGFAFGEGFTTSYEIGFVTDNSQISDITKDAISNIKTDSKPLFSINAYQDRDMGIEKLKDGDIPALLYFENDSLKLLYSSSSQDALPIISIVEGVADNIFQREPSNLELVEYTSEIDNPSVFQFIAPGLIIYGLIIIISQVAVEFSRLKEHGEVFRYFNSKVSSLEIIFGYFIYYFIIGSIQLAVLISSAVFFGMNIVGNPISIFIFAIPILMFVIGIGLIIGTIMGKPDPASNAATITGIILGFLSGSFIWNTRVEWLPTTKAAEGIIQIVQNGAEIAELLSSFAYVIIVSFGTLVIGTYVFRQKNLKN